MRTIFYTASNNGDGSYSVQFFDSQECITLLEEKDPEGYASGEGGGSFEVNGEITGVQIDTLEDVQNELSADA